MPIILNDVLKLCSFVCSLYSGAKSIAKAEKRAADSALAYRLKQKGYSNMEIGRRMGINESSVRNLLDPHLKVKNEVLNSTAKMIKENVDSKESKVVERDFEV